MFSDHKSTNRTLALFAFLASLLLYWITLAPTTSFWDSGEFIAVAHGLQVNHPPGAPFYSLIGRIVSMFMPAGYVAISINFLSAVASALTVMFLYLIIIRLVREWNPHPDEMPFVDRLGMYSGALLGALTFALTDTFWFSAVEAEVYAMSMFFTSIVVWLAFKWAEHHQEKGNERWLVLIAYMFGLALGVHLLNLLALFFVALIIYFKKKEFSITSFAMASGTAVLAFITVYPLTIQGMPNLMEYVVESSYGLIGPVGFAFLLILIVTGGLYFTHKNKYRTANIVILCYTMILIGYSSYALIPIRSIADPPIDENDPETTEAFISYLEREQYGETPLLTGYTYDNSQGQVDRENETFFPRRYSTNGQHMQQYGNYSSDLDYFLRYQVNHMYVRYFNWNFIGRDADIQNAEWQGGFEQTEYEDNPAHNSYFYIPFLLGLLGMIFHFQKDWRRALSVLALFLMTGLAIIVFLNQTPMEPRERDYAYVGSFFAFAIWIGMGGVSLFDMFRDLLKDKATAMYGLAGLLFVSTPGWMLYQNFDDHDRSERYVAADYANNLLQSVAPNGILLTNGDNDTFPLWYLQEVEGVRTDVRVVNLSLLNTAWYIKQLRDQWSHESPPLPITLSDEEINELTGSLEMHQPEEITLPVEKEMLSEAFSGDENYKKALGVPDTSFHIFQEGLDFGMPVDSLDDEVSWMYEGRSAGQDQQGNPRFYTQVQDEVILDILENSNWLRPIYFANTVSPQSQMDLHNYFRFEGKAFRVVPQHHDDVGSFGWLDPDIHADRLEKFKFREWNNPDAYFDENIRRMLSNYRYGVTELANAYMDRGEDDKASEWLSWGEERIPFKKLEERTSPLVLYAYNYAKADDADNAVRLANNGEERILENLRRHMSEYDELQARISRLEDEADEARDNANSSEQRRLQQQVESLSEEGESITQDMYMSISELIVIQHIYYMDDQDDAAENLINQVNEITSSRVEFPQNEEENNQQFEQLNL